MNEINEYLTSIGFVENDFGFLTHTIQGVKYTLLHDPLSGYALQYSYVKARTAGNGVIPLGRKPSLEDLQKAIIKIVG